MKSQRLVIVLTVVNLVLLVALLSERHVARAQEAAPVLRARALEIVDEAGVVRAQITISPETGTANGDAREGGVLFRLMDRHQQPLVKLGASADGSGLMLTGSAGREWDGVQLLAKPAGSSLRILNKGGQERIIKP